jgi:hypothetical protein
MALSMMYGLVVAVAISTVPAISRSLTATVVVASMAGFALWIANLLILAHVFGWTWFPDGHSVAVQFVAHTMMFGTSWGYSSTA